MKKIFILYIYLITIAITLKSCANKGYPEGGPKDETAPEVLYEFPLSFSTNFDKKRVQIHFNEFVQLKEINEKFIFSPPLEKNPKVSLRGKYINIDLSSDTLRPNTTYTMDFADAIVDNNENNPLGFYRYVFSTGEQIDTLELGGKLTHSQTNEPIIKAMVMLYESPIDSTPLLEIPDYIGITDSSGMFRITNIRNASYKVYAIEDADKNKKYTPEAETFAFIDSLITPTAHPITVIDTFSLIDKIIGTDTTFYDSISRQAATAFGPSNLELRMFKEASTQLYMLDAIRTERTIFDFTFSIPADNKLTVTIYDTINNVDYGQDWFIMEKSIHNDSIRMWIKDSIVYKKDTLNLILNYLRTDSLGQRTLSSDTSRYTFTEKENKKENNKKEKQDTLTNKVPEIEFLEITSNIKSTLNPGQHAYIEFNSPIDPQGLDSLILTETIDSIQTKKQFTITQDSIKLRKYNINYTFETEKKYNLSLDSALLYDIYGKYNNNFTLDFTVKSKEEFGNIAVNVYNVEEPTIIQLFKATELKLEEGKLKLEILKETIITEDEIVHFNTLDEGNYLIRAIIDKNNNGTWDTGLFLQQQQPEQILYLQTELQVKKNFDIEQDFDLSADHTPRKEEEDDEKKTKNSN